MSYANQTSVEGVLGRSLTTQEQAALPLLLSAIDEFINSQCETNFGEPVEATRYYDVDRGEPSRILDVDAFTTKMTEGEGDAATTVDKAFKVEFVDADENVVSTVDSSDYEACPRNENVKTFLRRRSSTWGRGCPATVTNIAVTAFFGYPSVPSDIQYAASYLAAQGVGGTASLSLKSESIEGYSRTFATITEQSPMISATFAKYRKVLM